MTRVLIECRDDEGMSWVSVGVSTNIISASVMALAGDDGAEKPVHLNVQMVTDAMSAADG